MAKRFRVLAATDGSPPATAALETALAFPWPEPSAARGVVALGGWPARVRAAAVVALYTEVDPTKRLLVRRWPDASVVALHEPPADAILSEARRFAAQAIVVGWRGHGAVRRLLAGSVSRELASRARIPVLVARSAVQRVRRVVIAFDGTAGARRAVRFVSRLEPRPGSFAVLASVVEPLPMPGTARLDYRAGAALKADVARRNREQAKRALRRARAAAALLRRAGWAVKLDVRVGPPLEGLLRVAGSRKDTVLVTGARATSGLRRLLLGSVAEGLLDHSPVPVVVVP